MSNLLFTSIGRRNQLVRHFKNHGWHIIGVDIDPEGCASQESADVILKVPPSQDPRYFDRLLDICQTHQVDVLIPLYEPELANLSELRPAFRRQGVEAVVSGKDTLDICLDKYKLYLFLKDYAFLTPETYLKWGGGAGQTKWVVKPRFGMGGKDVYIAEPDEVPFYFKKVSQPIVQKYIEGQEYSVDVFVGRNGQVLSVVPRLRLEVRGGEVSKSMTVEDREITNQPIDLVKKLGIYGPATLQGIREAATGKFYFIEVNPRFGGGVPLSIQAGIPYAKFLKDGYRQEPGILHPYQVGLKMLRYDEAIFVTEKRRVNV